MCFISTAQLTQEWEMPWVSTQMTGWSFRGSECPSIMCPICLPLFHSFIHIDLQLIWLQWCPWCALSLWFKDEDHVFCHVCRYQRYSTTHTPHNSERQRERQRGLVKQTFELDEAAATDRQDDQDDAKRRSVSLDDTPRGSWASSIFDLKNSSPDALLPSVLERTAAEDMDRRNAEARLQGRHSDLLGLFPPPDEVCPK